MTKNRRYFAQIGAEFVEIDAEHVALQRDGAAFSTSAPVLHYQVRATLGDPDKGSTSTVLGYGDSWDAAEESLAAQLPKEQK